MERRIYEAAVEGSVISLRNLLQEDALVLDRIMVGCYSETPLHIASMLGHVEFVQEILNQKPEFVRELDSRQSSPLHLAAAKGYVDIVKRLVSIDPEICFIRDRDGRNPLHIAVIKGHLNVLKEFIQIRPNATRISMDRGETILHACLRYNQFEAMKFLMESTLNDHDFVNSKDDDGNTILHLAVEDKQVEAVKFLTTNTAIEVNALNGNGLTAVDILTRSIRDVRDWEIGELLRRAGGISAKDGIHLSPHDLSTRQTRTSTSHEDNQFTMLNSKVIKDSKNFLKRPDGWLEKKYNVLMVVAALIAIMAFQAGLNPPGGVWQDDFQGNAFVKPHRAGFPILQDFEESDYKRFITYNSTSFVTSLSIILLVLLTGSIPCLRGRFFMWVLVAIMWVAINGLVVAYMISVEFLATEASFIPVIYIQLVWYGLMAILLLVHVIRLIVMLIKVGKKLVSRLGQRSRTRSKTDENGPDHTV